MTKIIIKKEQKETNVSLFEGNWIVRDVNTDDEVLKLFLSTSVLLLTFI